MQKAKSKKQKKAKQSKRVTSQQFTFGIDFLTSQRLNRSHGTAITD
jgi:hypothetical protein